MPSARSASKMGKIRNMTRFGICRECEYAREAPEDPHDVDPPLICSLLMEDVSGDGAHEMGCRLTPHQMKRFTDARRGPSLRGHRTIRMRH